LVLSIFVRFRHESEIFGNRFIKPMRREDSKSSVPKMADMPASLRFSIYQVFTLSELLIRNKILINQEVILCVQCETWNFDVMKFAVGR
jgi:hypothetical protein